MYEIANFEEYVFQPIGHKPVLVWSKKNGYQFLSYQDRLEAVKADRLDFKIVGVLKENTK